MNNCKNILQRAILFFFLLVIPFTANAEILSFEDLYSESDIWGKVPSDYGGFSWSTSAYWLTKTIAPGSGYEYGTIGQASLYTWAEQDISMSRSTEYFDFTGAYITSAWNTTQDVIIEGWRDGVVLHTETITTSYDQPYWFDFNYYEIDTVWFRLGVSGPNAGLGSSGSHVVIDNITTVVPEPISSILFITGGTLLAGRRYFRKRKELTASG